MDSSVNKKPSENLFLLLKRHEFHLMLSLCWWEMPLELLHTQPYPHLPVCFNFYALYKNSHSGEIKLKQRN